MTEAQDIQRLRAAIPADCFRPSAVRSIAHFAFDLTAIALLAWMAHRLDTTLFWVLYAPIQGTLFWALFVVGHDCGHHSFARSRGVNDLFGHLSHTPLLVPFHGWRLSHRRHHQNAGHVENDESWFPYTQEQIEAMPWAARWGRMRLGLLGFPFYLVFNTPGRTGSHFHPGSRLFTRADRRDVIVSDLWMLGMLALLAVGAWQFGALWLLKIYGLPYAVFVVWLMATTLLHHTDPDLPWYRDGQWSFLRGALSTLDRSYFPLDRVTHHIGLHVVHHVFHKIPHYHLRRATAAVRPVLGERYRYSQEPLWRALPRVLRECRWVPEQGERVFYESGRSEAREAVAPIQR